MRTNCSICGQPLRPAHNVYHAIFDCAKKKKNQPSKNVLECAYKTT